MAIAAKEKRILISHDPKTMPSEFAQFIVHNQSSGVIIVSRKVPIKTIIEEWINRIAKIPL